MFQAGEEEGHCLVKIISAQNENLFTYAYIHPFPLFLHHHDVQNHTYMHKYTSCMYIQYNALARGGTSMHKCDHHIIASFIYMCISWCIYVCGRKGREGGRTGVVARVV